MILSKQGFLISQKQRPEMSPDNQDVNPPVNLRYMTHFIKHIPKDEDSARGHILYPYIQILLSSGADVSWFYINKEDMMQEYKELLRVVRI